jgi:hypothetical protein
MMVGSRSFTGVSIVGLLILAACSDDPTVPTPDGGSGGKGGAGTSSSASTGGAGTGGTPLPTGLTAKITSTRFLTADHMLASLEMQISGEPFAELLGRSLGGYDRFSATTDNYTDPATSVAGTDALGFSLAVESYEYSKQPMNNLSFESGAGLSLQFGPLLNPAGVTGDPAFTLLGDRFQYFAKASRASGAKVGRDFVTVPAPTNDPSNYYGWPGFWPVFAEFRSFDPTIQPSVGADHMCDLAGAIDEPLPPGAVQTFVGDYECDTNSLILPNRDQQVDKVIEPDALGFAAWKQGLWAINYWGVLHDVDQNPIVKVPAANLAQVGEPGNTVIGQWPSPLDPSGQTLVFGKNGTFLGDVSLEGWQGLVMLEELDNKSALMLRTLTTTDGAALGGVASIQEAMDYDYSAPLRWWPASVAVTEAVTAPTAAEGTKYFPKPSFALQSGDSRLQDLIGMLGGFATFYAMTDANNLEVGGSQAFLATFDGSPFAADDGMPDGEDTAHDRALGILKMALVNADRIHFDPQNKVLVDTATPGAGGVVTRGTAVTTIHTAYSILALRTTLRSLNASLALYSNDTPDALGAPIPLDQTKLDGAPFTGTLEERIVSLIRAQADFLADKLLDKDGLAVNGYDLGKSAADPTPALLEAQAGAIRGLLEAYLATSDEKYRQRAQQAYAVLDKQFWMEDVRLFRTTAGESSKMTYTPRQFSTVHGALRQYYKLVASKPGQEAAAQIILDRIVRGMKLVVNGWNDANKDGKVQPEECLGGRLQMAERALTGEFSVAADNGDRDHDCVPDIATAKLPAALAAEIVIERK